MVFITDSQRTNKALKKWSQKNLLRFKQLENVAFISARITLIQRLIEKTKLRQKSNELNEEIDEYAELLEKYNRVLDVLKSRLLSLKQIGIAEELQKRGVASFVSAFSLDYFFSIMTESKLKKMEPYYGLYVGLRREFLMGLTTFSEYAMNVVQIKLNILELLDSNMKILAFQSQIENKEFLQSKEAYVLEKSILEELIRLTQEQLNELGNKGEEKIAHLKDELSDWQNWFDSIENDIGLFERSNRKFLLLWERFESSDEKRNEHSVVGQSLEKTPEFTLLKFQKAQHQKHKILVNEEGLSEIDYKKEGALIRLRRAYLLSSLCDKS